MKKRITFVISLLMVVSMLLVACAPAATPTVVAQPTAVPTTAPKATVAAKPTEVPTEAPKPTEVPTEVPVPAGKVTIRWFVGLGAGSNIADLKPQQQIVSEFNASNDHINLKLEIVPNASAYTTLATEMNAGNAPDIVGPVGIRGRDSFANTWLDVKPLIDKTKYDLSDYDPSIIQFYEVKGQGQLGVPFAIYPSFIIYNTDLFDEAGLPYPPKNYGDPYVDENGVSKEWNMDTLKELAQKLTVDANGNDPTMAGFDSNNIVQFGFDDQWTDPRGHGTLFAPGTFVGTDGKATLPEAWRTAWKWFYDGMWTSWFYPNAPYENSAAYGAGNVFNSNKVAMIHIHTWYLPCCMADVGTHFDFAPVPMYNGVYTAKMHADTFEIMKTTQHPDEAFEVVAWFLSPDISQRLQAIYGGMPARLSLQGDYFTRTFPNWTDKNWQVVKDGMKYADNPNHESFMPAFLETTDAYNAFWNKMNNTPGLDLDAEMDALIVTIQGIWDAAAKK